MTGIIWFVQIVHYPLFTEVGSTGFSHFEAQHRAKTFWVVAPLMLLELGTGLWLLFTRPTWLPLWAAWAGMLGIAGLWLSTFFIQVPLHARLDEGHQPEVIQKLVQSNWLRTAIWSLRSLGGMYFLFLQLS
ncbi:MAG: hypothetical protein AAF804_04270 [Bacteroidota bacterium]